MQERYKIILKTLSPIHIGTGEVLQPLEFYVGKDRIYEINSEVFLENLKKSELEPYLNIFKKEDREIIIDLFNFVQETLPKVIQRLKDQKSIFKKLIRVQIGIASEILERDFKEVMEEKIRVNTFQIYKTFKNVFYNPYLPGSSLKGSIRTAVLNYLNLSKRIKKED
ncbi:MAG: type III-A CRISPR-associated RAMP protein Csm5 [Caldimicrobium sp.]|nr:type III-A CRISPR-associated RAMP protein Csm5 [Caldimicrobium sp.]